LGNSAAPYSIAAQSNKQNLRGKFIAMRTYIKTLERSQVNSLMMHFELLEKNKSNPKSINGKK
jgi:hypothetical protein